MHGLIAAVFMVGWIISGFLGYGPLAHSKVIDLTLIPITVAVLLILIVLGGVSCGLCITLCMMVVRNIVQRGKHSP